MARIRKKIGSDAVIYGRTQSKGNLESDSGLIIKEGENNPPILDTTGNAIEVRKGVNVDEAVTVDSLTLDNIGMYEQIVVTNNNGMLTASTISLDELESLENINGNVQEQLDHEAGERAEADRVLTEGLARESSERADADNTLTQAIEDEADARQDADTSLSGRIDAEVNTRTTQVASLTNAIQTEADARLQEDTALNNKIDTEISDREGDVSDLNNAISGLTTQLTQEATARANKDSELQTAIENEASARESDVSGLRSDLTDETSARVQAVSGLTEAINGEIADRQNADGLLQTAIENEARDRTNEDASLDARLDAIEERIVLPWEEHDTLAKESDLNTAIGQVYTDLGSKVDKITATHSNTVAYVQTSGGEETYIPISATDTPDAIALRNPGGTIEVPMPNAGSEATNKSYVDAEIQYTRSALEEHTQDWNNPHSVTKEQVGLQYVENYPMDEHPQPDSSNYVSSGGVYSAIDTVQGTIYAHTMDENNPHNVTKEQLQLEHVVNRTMDSEPESGSMNYVESGGVYTAIQNVLSSLQVHEDDTYNPHQVTKEQVGLGNVDNTSDADKPVSSAQRDEFNAIQGIIDEHINNTSNPHQVTKTQVGLGYVENYPMDSTPSPSSSNYVSSGGVYTEIDRVEGLIDAHISDSSNPHNVTKEQVGLGNVDNTSDVDKPISSAQQTAIDGVQSNLNDHELDSNNPHNVTKSQVGLGNVDNTSDMDKPVSSLQSVAIGNVQSALDTHEQTYATATTYGHVKMDGTIGTGDRTDVTISEAGIKAYVNSSIGTSTADFLGTYNAVTDLGFTQTVVDTWTDPPTSAVESTVGNAITSVLNAESITPTSNDYVFVSVNESITTDIDWFWRFKFDGSVWLYEYTLNNSSFTQAQWDSINSGITNTKVGNYDTHVASRSNPHNVTKAQVGLGNVDNTSDLNKPISTATQTALDNKVGTVNQTGSGYVSAVAIDTTDKTKLNVTRTAIPNVAVTGGTAESSKYVSAIATNGHGITVTKATLPSLTKGATSGNGNVVSDISVSGHQITLTKGITAITDVSDKADKSTTVTNVSYDTTSKKIQQTIDGTTTDVVTLSTVATSGSYNDLSNKPTIPTVNNGTLTIKGGTTTATTFTANSSTSPTLTISGSGGTTVTGSANAISVSSTAVNDGTLNLKGAGTTVATFTANQSGTSNLDIVGDGSTTVTADTTNKQIKVSTPVLSTVATSGSYNDLSNKPTIPTVYNKTLKINGESTTVASFTSNSNTDVTMSIVGSGGTTVTPDATNKKITISTPVLATVATSGSYTDLSNKPTIPTVNNNKIDFKVGDTVAQTFTANQSSDNALSFAGSGGTSVSADTTNKKITISSTAVGNGTLTITQNGTSKGTFTANQSSAKTIALTDTWTPMTGATSSANGTVGYVNAVPPTEGYNTKYLRADGTWTVPAYPDISGKADKSSTVTNVSYNTSTKKIQKTINGTTSDVVTLSTVATSGSYNDLSNKPTIPDISGKADKSETVSNVSYNTTSKKIQKTINGTTTDVVTLSTVATSGSYNDLSNKPTIPDISGKADKSTTVTDVSYSSSTKKISKTINGTTSDVVTLSTVATTGAYSDLSGKPTIPDVSGKADKSETVTNVSYNSSTKKIQKTINGSTTDVVTLSTVATSGSYNDLSNKPTIPTVYNNKIDFKVGTTSPVTVQTFTANQSTDNALTFVGGEGISMVGDSTNKKVTVSEDFPIYYARPNETTATATLTASIGNFPSAYKDGIMIALRMPFNNVASTTLNVNGLGAKNVYYANNTTTKDRIYAGCVVLLVYETTTASTGCWKAVYSWDSGNTDTKARQTLQTGNYNLPLLMSYVQTSDTTANRDGVTYRNNSIYANPSTGIITATGFAGNLTGNVTGNVSGSAGSVAWGNVSSRPTKLSQFTNDVVNNATLTIQKNSTDVATFTANASSNVTANITVPTKTSELTNDSGYITSYTDTQNTCGAGNKTGTKLFLVGRSAQSTGISQSNVNCYIGTDNCLYSNGSKVLTSWTTVNDGTFNIQGDGNTVQSFTANATGTTNMNFVSGTGISLARDTTNKKITVNHSNSVTAQTSGIGSATAVPIIKYDAQGHITGVSTASIYPPTSLGMTGQLWKSNGINPGGWVDQSAITSGACSGNSVTATKMQYRASISNDRVFSRVSTSTSLSTDVSGYPWEYRMSLTGASTDHVPVVTFGIPDLNKNVWSPICNVKTNGYLTIYSKTDLGSSVTVSCGYVLN